MSIVKSYSMVLQDLFAHKTILEAEGCKGEAEYISDLILALGKRQNSLALAEKVKVLFPTAPANILEEEVLF